MTEPVHVTAPREIAVYITHLTSYIAAGLASPTVSGSDLGIAAEDLVASVEQYTHATDR